MKSLSILFFLSSLLFLGTSTFSQDDNFDFEIYPNPFNERLQLEIVSETSGMINVSLWNILGQNVVTIFEYDCNSELCGRFIVAYDVPNNFLSGVYFYVVKLDDKLIKIGKLVLIQ